MDLLLLLPLSILVYTVFSSGGVGRMTGSLTRASYKIGKGFVKNSIKFTKWLFRISVKTYGLAEKSLDKYEKQRELKTKEKFDRPEPTSQRKPYVPQQEFIVTTPIRRQDTNTYTVMSQNDEPVSDKVVCLNDVRKGAKELSDLAVLVDKVTNIHKKDRINADFQTIQGQLVGNDEVAQEILSINKPIHYMYGVVLEYNGEKYRFDHVVLSNEGIYLLDSSSIKRPTHINSEGHFFEVCNNGEKKFIFNPAEEHINRTEIFRNFLDTMGLECNIPIYPAVVLANKDASLKSEYPHPIDGFYPNYKRYISNIKCFGIANQTVKRIGYLLSEFNEYKSMDYLEKYDLQTEDFIRA